MWTLTGGKKGRTGRTELGREYRRRLIRVMLFLTAAVLCLYAVLRALSHEPIIALLELALSASCLLCARRVRTANNLTPWFIGYLIPMYTFLVAFTLVPELASPTAFVWVYLMPVLSYLLLGRLLGFLITVPFMVYMGAYGYLRLPPLESAQAWITLIDPVACALLVLFFMHFYETMRANDQAKLHELAQTDVLTGLANRRSFLSTLQQTIHESNRSKTTFSFAIMDIDYFKKINDTFGHNAGDEVLRHVAACLSDGLRKADSVGRLGGEEFGIILRGADSVANAHKVIENLRKRVAGIKVDHDNHTVTCTGTFGIAYWPQDSRSANELYKIADERLYEGKHAGRNRTVSVTPS